MEWVQAHLVEWAAPAVMLAVLAYAVKTLPGLLERKALAALEYLFEKGDAADDAWLCATIAWAEAKYGPGTGAIKATAAVDKIMGLLPLQYRIFFTQKMINRAVELFQESFDRLAAAAAKKAAEHKPI